MSALDQRALEGEAHPTLCRGGGASRGAPRPKATQTRAARESSESDWREQGGGVDERAAQSPAASVEPALGSAPGGAGRRAARESLSSSSSFFFPPALPNSHTLVCGRVSGPGLGPRSPAASRQEPIAQAPAPSRWPPRGYRITRRRSPGASAGCSKSPPPATATAGRPEVSVASVHFLVKPTRLGTRAWNKNKKVQLLAVDHSAHASMKNAASCEK